MSGLAGLAPDLSSWLRSVGSFSCRVAQVLESVGEARDVLDQVRVLGLVRVSVPVELNRLFG